MEAYLTKNNATASENVIIFPMLDTAANNPFKTGLTWAAGDVKISIDGAAPVNTTNLPIEIGTLGVYKVQLTQAETNGDVIVVVAKKTGALDQAIVIRTKVGKIDADVTSRHASGAAVASVTGNVSGNVVGSVGSVVADVGITQAGADKVWLSATRTLTSFGTLVSDIWASLTSGMTTVGSIGKKLADWSLGTDNKVVLSNNPHTGAVVPTVTTVTNDVGITQAGADKVWGSATRTLTSFGTLIADIWGYSSRTLTAFSTGLALSVWDVLESAILTASSIGLKVKTNLDALVSSRAAPGDILTTPANKLSTDATGRVTVGTNADKTGYELSAAGVDAVWDDAQGTEPAALPTTMRGMVWLLFMRFFNKVTQTATQQKVFKSDGTTVIGTMTTSDDGTTQTKGRAA